MKPSAARRRVIKAAASAKALSSPHKRVRPASLDGDPIDRPWRHTYRPIDTR